MVRSLGGREVLQVRSSRHYTIWTVLTPLVLDGIRDLLRPVATTSPRAFGATSSAASRL